MPGFDICVFFNEIGMAARNLFTNMPWTARPVFERPPRGETDILDIFEKETVGGKALILGDFNVHSPLWEVTTYENKAGKV